MRATRCRRACLLICWLVSLLGLTSVASAQDCFSTAVKYAQQNNYVLFLAGLFTGYIVGSVVSFSALGASSWKVVPQVALSLIVIAAVVTGSINWAQGIVVVLAGVMAIIAATRAVERFGQGDRIELQSHWGGLGGGLGGWRLSPGASLVVLALMLSSIGIAGLVALSKGAPEAPPALPESSAGASNTQTAKEGPKPAEPEKTKSE